MSSQKGMTYYQDNACTDTKDKTVRIVNMLLITCNPRSGLNVKDYILDRIVLLHSAVEWQSYGSWEGIIPMTIEVILVDDPLLIDGRQ
jgi:hypothetical protein